MSYKKWVNAEIDKAKASALSEKLNIDAFVAFLLEEVVAERGQPRPLED